MATARRNPAQTDIDTAPPRATNALFQSVGPYAVGLATPVVCTLIEWPFRELLAPASMLMAYLLGVVLVASRLGRGPSMLASLISAPAFAYFFAPPIFSLAMRDLENIFALAVMLVTAHVSSGLLEGKRLQAALASARERRAQALYRLSEALSDAPTATALATTAVRLLHAEWGLRAVVFWSDEAGTRLLPPLGAPLWASLRGIELGRARAAYEKPALDGGELGHDIDCHALVTAGHRLGLIAIGRSGKYRANDPEQRAFVEMLLQLLAQAAQRLCLAERAKAAAIQAETEALRNSLLSAISHDLRTPLTRIVGAAGALAEHGETLTPSERLEYTDAIQAQARHMAELMGKVLDMARISNGRIDLHWEWSAVEELVGAALLRLDDLLGARTVDIRLPEALPLVRLDAVLMQQVFVNLIENAAKYSPAPGLIEIRAAADGGGLSVIVADRGPGLAPDALERVFDTFYRGKPESETGGAGLGLSFCRAIVEAHGGTLCACNRSGGGAEFCVRLPLGEAPALPDWPEPGEGRG